VNFDMYAVPGGRVIGRHLFERTVMRTTASGANFSSPPHYRLK
jgi:hypothetical protein